MKKLVPVLLAIVLTLGVCACGNTDNAETSAPTASPEQLSGYIGDALLTVYRGLIDSAVYSAKNIFAYGSLECAKDEPAVVQNGRSYYRVTSERFSSYGILKQYIESIFTASAASKLMAENKYVEIDGVLYCDCAAFETNPDLVLDGYSFIPSDKTPESCTLTVSVKLNGEDALITLNAICSDGDWRLDSPINTLKIKPIERSVTA